MAFVQVSQNEPEDVIQNQIWSRLATDLEMLSII